MAHGTTTASAMVSEVVADAIPRVMETANSMPATIASKVPLATGSSSWIGFLGRLVLAVLHLVTGLLYWTIRLITISLPTLLFTMFSTNWTVTMNATTLYGVTSMLCRPGHG